MKGDPARELIAGRYDPIEVVGRGGEGTLMRARDTRSDVDVALKLRPLPDRPDAAMRMEHEAGILRNVRPHAGLPIVRDAFTDGSVAVLVMSWIGGRDLVQLLHQEGDPGIGFDAALRIIEQVADALDHLHAHHPPIVHGDVKPANVIIAPNGRAMLVDFGGAMRPGLEGAATGTRGFRAPEVVAGAQVGPAADVYALAATFYALLAGRPPRFGVRATWDGLDGRTAARLDEAFRTALAIDPERRPPSAGAFVASVRPRRSRTKRGPSNLPMQVERVVGRARLIAEVAARASEARLLTLLGPGGVGKSRVAVEAARRAAARLGPDGVVMVPMDVGDPDHVVTRVASALKVREAADLPAADVVVESLRTRRMLLLLDGCEHAPEAVASLADDILTGCPDVTVLATSRLPLGVADERVHHVEPLGPDAPAALDLFWERARVADPTITRRGRNARAAAAICRVLAGMPLAIELAAAGVAERSPAEILERIQREDDPALDAIRRSVRWAMDGVGDAEAALLRRMTMFIAGCRAEDAADVCADVTVDAAEVTTLLWRLVDRSLLQVEDAAGVLRYKMPDAVREEARERLGASGELDMMRARRLAWARDLAAAGAAGMSTPGQPQWLARLAFEHDNLRSAMADGMRLGDPSALAIAADLGRFWYLHGHWREGRWWYEQLLRDAPPGRIAGIALTGCARLCEALGDYEQAREMFERAVTELRAVEDATELGAALNGYAYAFLSAGDLGRAGELYEEARVLASQADDLLNHTGALLGRATVAATAQRWEEAIRYAELALAVAREIGEPAALALCLTTLAGAEISARRFDEADIHLQEALSLRRLTGDRMGEAVTLNALGELSRRGRDDRVTALTLFRQSLAIREELGHAAGIATMLNNVGTVTDDPDEQLATFQKALEIRRRLRNDAMTAIALRALSIPYRTRGAFDRAAELLAEALALDEKHQDREGVAETIESLAKLADAAGDRATQDRLVALAPRVRSGESDLASAAADARSVSARWRP